MKKAIIALGIALGMISANLTASLIPSKQDAEYLRHQLEEAKRKMYFNDPAYNDPSLYQRTYDLINLVK